jgi:flagellar basal body-associated protein FliL
LEQQDEDGLQGKIIIIIIIIIIIFVRFSAVLAIDLVFD